MARRPERKRGAPSGKLRIIGGRWRGRRLTVAAVPGLRPTGDRIRETLFNWLAPRIDGARGLDLFAGTGALGLEALSRGAARMDFVDSSALAAGRIAELLEELGATDTGTVVQRPAQAFLAGASGPYDLVFVDPPFDAGLWDQVLAALPAVLAPRAQVYLEAPAEYSPQLDSPWQLQREKQAGGVSFRLMEYSRGH